MSFNTNNKKIEPKKDHNGNPPKPSQSSNAGKRTKGHSSARFAFVILLSITAHIVSLGISFSNGYLVGEYKKASNGSQGSSSNDSLWDNQTEDGEGPLPLVNSANVYPGAIASVEIGFVFLIGPLISLLSRHVSFLTISILSSAFSISGHLIRFLWCLYTDRDIMYLFAPAILIGMGAGGIFFTAVSVIDRYATDKRRDYALSIIPAGSPFAIALLPSLYKYLQAVGGIQYIYGFLLALTVIYLPLGILMTYNYKSNSAAEEVWQSTQYQPTPEDTCSSAPAMPLTPFDWSTTADPFDTPKPGESVPSWPASRQQWRATRKLIRRQTSLLSRGRFEITNLSTDKDWCLGRKQVWLLIVSVFLWCAGSSSVFVYLYPYLVSPGRLEPASAVQIMMAVGLAGVFGRVPSLILMRFDKLTGREGQLAQYGLFMAIYIFATFLFMAVPRCSISLDGMTCDSGPNSYHWAYGIIAALFGAGFSGQFGPMFATFFYCEEGRKHEGDTMIGVNMLAQGLGNLIGPLALDGIGQGLDNFPIDRSYVAIFTIAGSMEFLALLLLTPIMVQVWREWVKRSSKSAAVPQGTNPAAVPKSHRKDLKLRIPLTQQPV